jgi:hypothetical protein
MCLMEYSSDDNQAKNCEFQLSHNIFVRGAVLDITIALLGVE